MLTVILALLATPSLETNVVNQGNPSTGIQCPIFMTKGEAIFGGPDVKPRGHNKVLQRHMCYVQVVKPLQMKCLSEGYKKERCVMRTIKWIKRRNQK